MKILNRSLATGLGILAFCCLSSFAWGNTPEATPPALKFEATSVPLQLGLGERTGAVEFKFTNNASGPISIKEIKTSCGCAVAETLKKSYIPGESGSIVINYKGSGTLQESTKNILVTTDEPSGGIYQLALVVRQVVVASLSSTRETWAAGGVPDERVIVVEVKDRMLHITEAVSSNDAFDVRLVTVKPRELYKVVVVPRLIEEQAVGSLRLRTDFEKSPSLTARLEITKPNTQ